MGYLGYTMSGTQKEYCLYDENVRGQARSSHPARFSPDDTLSKYRIATKKKYGLLPFLQDDVHAKDLPPQNQH